MNTRRGFLGGMLATSLAPHVSWADVGGPAFLSAARDNAGRFHLCGVSASGQILFRSSLPDRGHAAAAHPVKPEAVCFARRPGRFALVVDCLTGRHIAQMDAPLGRHFYGHGVFSQDGRRLYTTENDYESARGIIGIWDAADGFRRIGEMPSGGVGPHDLKRLPEQDTLVVANGGIETHPESGRAKLNLPTMRSNLSYLDPDGAILAVEYLPDDMRLGSIRHLAVAPSGRVAFGIQWQGDATASTGLVGTHLRGDNLRVFSDDTDVQSNLNGYVGSIAMDRQGHIIAATSPRGGICYLYDAMSGKALRGWPAADVCGVAAHSHGFVATTGQGGVFAVNATGEMRLSKARLAWDNHLVDLKTASV